VREWLKRSASKAGEKLQRQRNKELISPSIAEDAVCAANFAPFLHFFENHFNFNFNFFASPWLSCLGTLSIAVSAVD